MDHEYEWHKLLVLEQLSDYGKDQFKKMPQENQESLVYDAMMSDFFNGIFPTNNA